MCRVGSASNCPQSLGKEHFRPSMRHDVSNDSSQVAGSNAVDNRAMRTLLGTGLSRQDSGILEIRDLVTAVRIWPGSPTGADRVSCWSIKMSTFKITALTMWCQLPRAARFPIAATTAIVILLAMVGL